MRVFEGLSWGEGGEGASPGVGEVLELSKVISGVPVDPKKVLLFAP